MTLPDYRKDENISPCPKCGGEVEWSNTRCLNILESMMDCNDCEISFFRVETVTFLASVLPSLDYESALMKYNAWCATKPTSYGEHEW